MKLERRRIWTFPCRSPGAKSLLSEVNTTRMACSVNAAAHDASLVLHSPAVPIRDVVAMYFPFGEK